MLRRALQHIPRRSPELLPCCAASAPRGISASLGPKIAETAAEMRSAFACVLPLAGRGSRVTSVRMPPFDVRYSHATCALACADAPHFGLEQARYHRDRRRDHRRDTAEIPPRSLGDFTKRFICHLPGGSLLHVRASRSRRRRAIETVTPARVRISMLRRRRHAVPLPGPRARAAVRRE